MLNMVFEKNLSRTMGVHLSSGVTMSRLFSPLTIRSTTFSNRAWISPMCQYSAIDGVVGQWHLVHLGGFAIGGAGLVMAEATAVTPEGRISIGCPGLWNDEQVDAWRTVTDFVHSQGTKVGVQLAHAGRKASTMLPWSDHPMAGLDEGGWETVGPSAIPFPGYPTPRALTLDECLELPRQFAEAALRAIDAGFDVLEIHAAHGYLLHEFLSPLSNHRDDAYGGSFENRSRLLVAVAVAVRAVCGETPLFVRISATDWSEGGWGIDEAVQLAVLLREVGVDLIDTSSGGNVPASIPVGPGYQVPFAQRIGEESGIATSAVGMITSGEQAEAIMDDQHVVAVMVARAAMRNPHWPLQAAHELGDAVEWRPQLERGRWAPKG
jgi:2,4-dienoyl-CoA reductase-like NADH-dependent reductase (Old Yellow Enzyme family)